MKITLRDICDISAARSARWHKDGLTEWTILEWAGAMCGEAGEAANVAKKIRRVELGAAQRARESDRDALLQLLGEELADTLLYLVLVAARTGIDLEAAIIAKFDKTSEEYGFPERLGYSPEGLTPDHFEFSGDAG